MFRFFYLWIKWLMNFYYNCSSTTTTSTAAAVPSSSGTATTASTQQMTYKQLEEQINKVWNKIQLFLLRNKPSSISGGWNSIMDSLYCKHKVIECTKSVPQTLGENKCLILWIVFYIVCCRARGLRKNVLRSSRTS